MGRRIGLAAALTALLALAIPGAASALAPTPDRINFGKQKVGTRSDTVTVTVQRFCIDVDADPGPGFSPAPGPCEALDVAISGQFEIVATRFCSPGSSTSPACAIDVRFTPRDRGRQRGFLRVSSPSVIAPAFGPGVFAGVPLKGRGRVPKGKARRLRAKGKKVGKKNVCKSKRKKGKKKR